MPMFRLTATPGVDVERTPTTMRGGYVQSNLIKFREGLVEKWGGWQRICNTQLAGVGRTLHFWDDLTGTSWLAAGTNLQLYVEQNGVLYNISPVGWPGGFPDAGHGMYSPLIWSLDNFGQNLIGIPSGGSLYQWVPGQPPALATRVTQAPAVNIGGFVAMPEQIVMAYGCTPLGGGNADPLLVRWCDQSDITDWTASTTNQAGSFRLSRGSKIVGGISCALGQFLWTDLDFWQVQYQGFPLVFGFQMIGPNSGLMAPNAIVAYGSQLFWLSDHGPFVYSGGGVQPIPCTVWDKLFTNLNTAQAAKCVAGSDYNRANDIIFCFPSATGTGEVDSYIKFNTMENLWDYGDAPPGGFNLLARTAWTDQNRPGGPLSIDRNNLIQQQDIGVDADGQPMTGVMIRSGYMDIQEGDEILFVSMLIPDLLWRQSTNPNPSLQMTLYFRNWPGDTPTAEGPFTITPTTQYVTPRTRAREVAVQLNCDGLGVWFRMGTSRLRFQPDGKI